MQGLLAGQSRRRPLSHSQGPESASEWEEGERQLLPGNHLQGSQKLQSRYTCSASSFFTNTASHDVDRQVSAKASQTSAHLFIKQAYGSDRQMMAN